MAWLDMRINWIPDSVINGCITVIGRYKKFSIIVSIFYKGALPYSVTRIYDSRDECNYSQTKEANSKVDALFNAEKFAVFMIDDPEINEISRYLKNSHFDYTWIDSIDNSSLSLTFGEKIENGRFCTLVGRNINIRNVMTKVFKLNLFGRHGIEKYAR